MKHWGYGVFPECTRHVYLGNRVSHLFQKTARILADTAITMFLEAIARQWILSNKNAGKAVDFARYDLPSVHC